MRFVIPAAAALAMLALPALAQTTTTTPPAATPPASTAPATTPPAASTTTPSTQAAPKKMVGHRQTLQQRFDAANAAHDGHLTKDDATAAKWSYITKNFDAIDADKKGYVTMDDIHAYSKAHHATHAKATKPKPATTPAAAPATNG